MADCMISVIIPVYNTEVYLEECLQSVLTQTFRDFEVIIVDDGSTDGSASICDRFAQEFPNIKAIHQKNQGVSAARNAGISHARGKYLLFLDSDDVIHPQMLSLLADIQEKENAVLLGWKVKKFKNKRKGMGVIKKDEFRIQKGTLSDAVRKSAEDANFTGYVWNKLFVRDYVSDAIRFDPNIKIMEDTLFGCQYMVSNLHKGKFIYLDFPLYYYRQVHNSALHAKYSEKNLTAMIAQDMIIDLLKREKCFDLEVQIFRKNLLRAICIAYKKIRFNRILLSDEYKWNQKICELYMKYDGFSYMQKESIKLFCYKFLLEHDKTFWNRKQVD